MVRNIVWFEGKWAVRGWDQVDFDGRRRWVYALALYLLPLWESHPTFKDQACHGLRTADIRARYAHRFWEFGGPQADLDKLEQSEHALLGFWIQCLYHDFGIIPTPFFPAADCLKSQIHCDRCNKGWHWQ